MRVVDCWRNIYVSKKLLENLTEWWTNENQHWWSNTFGAKWRITTERERDKRQDDCWLIAAAVKENRSRWRCAVRAEDDCLCDWWRRPLWHYHWRQCHCYTTYALRGGRILMCREWRVRAAQCEVKLRWYKLHFAVYAVLRACACVCVCVSCTLNSIHTLITNPSQSLPLPMATRHRHHNTQPYWAITLPCAPPCHALRCRNCACPLPAWHTGHCVRVCAVFCTHSVSILQQHSHLITIIITFISQCVYVVRQPPP